MPKKLDKYLCDGKDHISEEYGLKRILEYASFPDLITYPVEDLKKVLPAINMDGLRTSRKRKTSVKLILPFVPDAQSWEDIINRLIKA